MSINLEFGPAQAKLILDPDTYDTPATNETDLGLIGTAHIGGFSLDVDTFQNPYHGTTLTDARIMGVNWVYNITLIEYSTEWLSLVMRGVNTIDTFKEWNGYNLGHLIGDGQTSSLLIRPIDDDGDGDATKPMLWIPRGVVLGAYSFIWDRQAGHVEAVQLTIAALLGDNYTVPAFYGDSTTFPALP